jgi:hypothetical protein
MSQTRLTLQAEHAPTSPRSPPHPRAARPPTCAPPSCPPAGARGGKNDHVVLEAKAALQAAIEADDGADDIARLKAKVEAAELARDKISRAKAAGGETPALAQRTCARARARATRSRRPPPAARLPAAARKRAILSPRLLLRPAGSPARTPCRWLVRTRAPRPPPRPHRALVLRACARPSLYPTPSSPCRPHRRWVAGLRARAQFAAPACSFRPRARLRAPLAMGSRARASRPPPCPHRALLLRACARLRTCVPTLPSLSLAGPMGMAAQGALAAGPGATLEQQISAGAAIMGEFFMGMRLMHTRMRNSQPPPAPSPAGSPERAPRRWLARARPSPSAPP